MSDHQLISCETFLCSTCALAKNDIFLIRATSDFRIAFIVRILKTLYFKLCLYTCAPIFQTIHYYLYLIAFIIFGQIFILPARILRKRNAKVGIEQICLIPARMIKIVLSYHNKMALRASPLFSIYDRTIPFRYRIHV